MELFIWRRAVPLDRAVSARRDLAILKKRIEKQNVFILQASQPTLPRSRLFIPKSRLGGMKILHMNTPSRSGGMKYKERIY